MSAVSPRFALLVALSGGPGYGLELVERIKKQTGGAVTIAHGSLYPTLRELEREGLVVATYGDQRPAGHGGRPRRWYKLTSAGKKEAQANTAAIQALLANKENS